MLVSQISKTIYSYISTRKFQFMAIALTAILGLIYIDRESYWFDEAYSVHIIRHLDVLIRELRTDFNMWLYYALLIPWVRIFGYSEAATRSLSVVFSVLSVSTCLAVVRRWHPKALMMAAILFPLNTAFVYFSQELRSYSLTMFLTAASIYCYLSYSEKSTLKSAGLYFLSIVLPCYSHFFGAFVVSSQMLYSIIRKKWMDLLFIPILLIFLSPAIIASQRFSAYTVFWSYPITFYSLGEIGYKLLGGFGASIVAFLAMLAVIKDRKPVTRLVAFIPLVFMSCIIGLMFIGKPYLVTRYLTPIVPPILILAAIGASYIRKKRILTIILLIYMMLSGIKNTQEYIKLEKEDFRASTTYVCIQPRSVIVPYPDFVSPAISAYTDRYCLGRHAGYEFISHAQEERTDRSPMNPPTDPEKVSRVCLRYASVIIFVRNQQSSYFGKELDASSIRDQFRDCYPNVQQKNFTGITIERYWR